MFKKTLFTLAFLFALFFDFSEAYSATKAELLDVHDGDTITVLAHGKKIKIRLYGIDAPELDQDYGKQSRNTLKRLLADKKISYKTEDKDMYGRTVATIYADKQNVNLEMIKLGYAWHYKAYARSQELAEAQEYARANGAGLWQDSNPTPPWEFRKEKPENSLEKNLRILKKKLFGFDIRKLIYKSHENGGDI